VDIVIIGIYTYQL